MAVEDYVGRRDLAIEKYFPLLELVLGNEGGL